MFENLEQLQAHGSLTDTCLVGASSKVFIHRAILFADHVQPDSVWYQLDPGEGDGSMVVIVPDASDTDLETFVHKLYCPNTKIIIMEVLGHLTPKNVFTTITAPFNIWLFVRKLQVAVPRCTICVE